MEIYPLGKDKKHKKNKGQVKDDWHDDVLIVNGWKNLWWGLFPFKLYIYLYVFLRVDFFL